jgi:hypothetical protein
MLSIAGSAPAQAPGGDDIWQRLLQDSYSLHDKQVREMLPPHSGLPPVLDLSKPPALEEMKDLAWERDFKGYFISGTFTDPGVTGLAEATSIATKFMDGAGPVYGLPARVFEAVVIAKAVKVEARLDGAHSFVYSRSLLEMSRVLKGNRKHGIVEGATAFGVDFGGTIRFPSGHVETFILANNGFLEQDKQYLIFMWKPRRSVNTYLPAEAYLIQDGAVFAVNSVGDVAAYNGMPFEKFEAKVKAAIAQNIDTN